MINFGTNIDAEVVIYDLKWDVWALCCSCTVRGRKTGGECYKVVKNVGKEKVRKAIWSEDFHSYLFKLLLFSFGGLEGREIFQAMYETLQEWWPV